MKIKHITFLDTTNNYGQVLQCLALQRQLVKLGHEAKLIRYCPSTRKMMNESPLTLRGVALAFKKLVEGRLKERLLARRNGKLDKKRDFQGFISENITCTETYGSIGSLRRNPPEADVYICGSDQIWGKDLLEDDTAAWFLDFGSDCVRRVAYAPSIGRNYADEEIPVLERYLSRFQSISTREESAARQCRMLGFDAAVVVDPTLLLNRQDYLDLASGVQKNDDDYLFAYVLNVKNKEDISWSEVARFVDGLGISVRAVYSSGYYQARPLIPNVEPECATIQEWLAAIRDARCVVTTSFHGAVFCILLHKPFIVFALAERERANDRLMTLLGSLGLIDRLFTPSVSFGKQMECPIDWDKVDERLEPLRATSIAYIKKALKAEEDDKGDTL